MMIKRRYVAGIMVGIAGLIIGLVSSAGAENPVEPRLMMVAMPDGVQLATDVYLPHEQGPWPVLVMRTPYGRDMAREIGQGLAGVGVVTVAQDVRGRYDSEGVYSGFFDERSDGQATLEWILNQEWSSDRIVTFGGSALGIAQYMLAPGAPDALRCQWIEVGTPDLYSDLVYEGGAYRTELVDLWLEALDEEHIIPEWQAHPLNTAYWDPVQIVDDFAQVNTTAVQIGGWYDIFARGMVDGFLGYQEQGGPGAAGHQHLIMGPWTHTVNDPVVGEITFPDAVYEEYETLFFLWVDACLLEGGLGVGTREALDALPAVTYYTMGAIGEPDAPGNEWHTTDTWPPAGVDVPVYLHADGILAGEAPAEQGGADRFMYDPADPAPTICGRNLNIAAGMCDQRPLEGREDVLVYSTGALPEPVEVTGDIRSELWVSTDVPDTDIVVRLTDVYPDGRSMLVADGIARLSMYANPDHSSVSEITPGEPVRLTIDLGPTSIVFNQGHSIRISVTSSNAPRSNPNPNTGARFASDEKPAMIAHTSILHDAAHPSAFILPMR